MPQKVLFTRIVVEVQSPILDGRDSGWELVFMLRDRMELRKVFWCWGMVMNGDLSLILVV
jgi:hypothetical protein